jgi:hypothetical protein
MISRPPRLRTMGLLIASLACGSAVTAQPWQPPIGIPAPPFGIVEQAPPAPNPWTAPVAGFYYVEESAPGSTDSGNPFGHPGLPRRTIPNNLPAGSVVELRGTYTRYHTSPNDLRASGTVGSPVFIRGASITDRPRVTGTFSFIGPTAYVIVENIEFAMGGPDRSVFFVAPTSQAVLRHCEVRGNLNGGGVGIGTFSSAHANNIVVYNTLIHDNGNINATFDQDIHGIVIGGNTHNVWIVDNELVRNSGDGVQINSQGTSDHIYMGRNVAHHNKQTGLSSKQNSDIIFSQNHVYGHRASNSSNGACLGFQYNPNHVWFLFNVLHECDYGIAGESDLSSSGQNIYVIGNLFYNIHTTTAFNPNTGWQHAAVRMTGGTNRFFINNTMHDVDTGISSPSLIGNLNIHNNAISGVTRGSHVFVEQLVTANASTIDNNIFEGTVKVKWGSNTPLTLPQLQANFGKCSSCIAGNPAYVNPAAQNYRLQVASPAANSGALHAVYATFQSRYGIDIQRDVAASVRPVGPWDMGAYEITPTPVPTAALADFSDNEGSAGPRTYDFTVTLSNTTTDTVTIAYVTRPTTFQSLLAPLGSPAPAPEGGSKPSGPPVAVLPGPAANFAWAATPEALEYRLEVGAPGDPQRYFGSSVGREVSRAVSGLPTDGSVVVVRVHARDAGGWHTVEHTFRAATAGS